MKQGHLGKDLSIYLSIYQLNHSRDLQGPDLTNNVFFFFNLCVLFLFYFVLFLFFCQLLLATTDKSRQLDTTPDLKVDFHCRVNFTSVTHVYFTGFT